MRKPSRYGRNIISNISGNAVNSVIQLGLLLVLIRALDDTAYAAFLSASFLVGLLEMASDYGGRIWATREFSVSDSPRAVLIQSVNCKLFYTIVSAAILSLIPFNTLSNTAFVLSVLVACTQPSTDPFLWFLRGRERLDVEAIVVLLSRVLIVIGMIVATLAELGLPVLLVIWLVGNISRMLIESRLAAVRPVLQITARSSDEYSVAGSGPQQSLFATVATIKHVFPVGTAFVLTSLFQRATIFFLDVFATAQDVKIYGTAFKIVNTSGFLATGVFVSSFAMLAKAIDANDLNGVREVVRRKLLLVTMFFVQHVLWASFFPFRFRTCFIHSSLRILLE